MATPLELFFDLAVVVAVSTAAAQLHHAVSSGHLMHGLVGFLEIFCSVWWAWVNYTWFSSAFDTDDMVMRFMTMVQMAGVLVLAAGVPRAFEHGDFTVVVIGYLIMRVALLLQWVRAERESGDPEGICHRYWTALLCVQLYWVARLWTHGAIAPITLLLGFVLELLVPVYAERRTSGTSWHPEHIAERYGAFVIIVCGEVILSASGSFNAAFTTGLTAQLLLVAMGAILIVFTVWSFYFHREHSHDLVGRGTWVWAYLHYAIFASVAAMGAGIGVMVDLAQHEAKIGQLKANLLLTSAVAVYLVFLGLSSWVLNRYLHELAITLGIAGCVLGIGFLQLGPGATTALIGAFLLACLVGNSVVAARMYGSEPGEQAEIAL